MTKLNLGIRFCSVVLLWAIAALGLAAQAMPASSTTPIFNTMFSFDFTDGSAPEAALVQGTDGNLYGTTFGGGCGQENEGEGCGTVFKITPGGKQEVLYLFCSQGGNLCTDGLLPAEGLIQGTDGNFYGSTSNGGTGYDNDQGTVFNITPTGKLTTLYSFCSDYDPKTEECLDGAKPSTLIQGADGNFYGVTGAGGDNVYNAGTFFKISSGGTLTTLYNFCSEYKNGGCADGQDPSGVVRGTDGKFYGTTARGGTNDGGTVFSITAGGALTTLYSFCSQTGCTDGYYPLGTLVQGADGNFYGTTSMGGTSYGSGTVFSITTDGTLTTMHSFGGVKYGDGSKPLAGLVLGTDGNFYGTTEYGGNNNGQCGPGCGTIFQITPKGAEATLYQFCLQHINDNCTDGSLPFAGLIQDTNGMFYGTAESGGANIVGEVFSLSMGLGPFVETNPVANKVEKKVGILGTNLTGASSVTFHGVAASFEVKSPTLIVAEVPSGATSGKVQVQLPSGPLSSNVPFIVLK